MQTLTHESEVLHVSYRPDGKELCTCTLGGAITFWDIEAARVSHSISERMPQGRLSTSRTRARAVNFSVAAYSACGGYILAAGDAKYVCVYDVATQRLLKRFTITKNKTLDGVLDQRDSRMMTEAGNVELIEDGDEAGNARHVGARKQDASERRTPPIMRVMDVQFAPTGRSFSCATTQGVVVYSLDDYLLFDPFDLEVGVTPDAVRELCDKQEWTRALVFSLRIGENGLKVHVMNAMPSDAATIELVLRDLPTKYLDRLLKFLVVYTTGRRLEFALEWVRLLVKVHGRYVLLIFTFHTIIAIGSSRKTRISFRAL